MHECYLCHKEQCLYKKPHLDFAITVSSTQKVPAITAKQIGNTFSFLVQRTEQIMKSLFYLTKRTYKVFMQNVLKLILLCCSQLISCVSSVVFSREFQFSLISVRTKMVFSILSYCFCILFEQAETFGKQSCWKFLIMLKDPMDEVASK